MGEKSIENVDLSLANKDFPERYGRKKSISIYTLGCKVNQYESEAVSSLLEEAGYEVVGTDEEADIYIINTCTVTGISARKSRQMIRRAKSLNENSVVVVMGCYSQTSPEEVSNIPGVNLIIGTNNRNKIVEYLDMFFKTYKTNEAYKTNGNKINKSNELDDIDDKNADKNDKNGKNDKYDKNETKLVNPVEHIEMSNRQLNIVSDIMKTREFENLRVSSYKDRTRAYIKVQEGCTQFCSYCIIPYARGPVRSRNPEEVAEEVAELAGNNFKEIVLTGIHVASYGKDIGNISLLDLIYRIHEIPGIERIRLSSIEPTIFDDDFVQAIKSLKKLCPHYHISLQSGCDETLRRMNRKYTTAQYENVVNRLRDNIEDISVTTDIMVGFPGETDEEFETTYSFLKRMNFAKMHIFKYSSRKGTPAASFSNQVPGLIKEERSKRLIELSKECSYEFHKRFLGRQMPILFEKEVDSSIYRQLKTTDLNLSEKVIEGLSPNYIRVFCNGNDSNKGEIRNVVLKEAFDEIMIGAIV
ncbi:MAG: tRNA (N(6)-L-threonylcarbamoyladenosine(37)-C(2))-methylthiotransferase MtaB [Clostridiaceae bacterium]|jgi:threonylcarbamoyladenosine tRNA methylthiotransferase MtaB|nr:tRNA (N(6)-L-threonylcarbamoyladenosine(37)-C(2))-methylthiotransferase MtaB [Clostridiaceae bacterium]